MCNCNSAGSITDECDLITGQCSCLPATTGRDCSQCINATFNLQDSNPNGCQPCFCSGQSSVCSSAPRFFYTRLSSTFNTSADLALQGWQLTDIADIDNDAMGSGAITQPFFYPLPGEEGITIQAQSAAFLEAPSNYVGNKLSSYSRYLRIEVLPVDSALTIESVPEYDVILVGNEMTLGANFSRTESGFQVQLHELAGWVRIDISPSTPTSTQEFQLILSSLSRLLISVDYSTDVILRSVSLDTTAHESEITIPTTDLMVALSVEECQCPGNYAGLSCEECAPGFTRTSSGECEPCNCNGFSTDCDPDTGECRNCTGFTTGPFCDMCARGYYGEPLAGTECLPCPCPHTEGPGQFTNECFLRSGDTEVVCLNCPPGHTGMCVSILIKGCKEYYFGSYSLTNKNVTFNYKSS